MAEEQAPRILEKGHRQTVRSSDQAMSLLEASGSVAHSFDWRQTRANEKFHSEIYMYIMISWKEAK